MPARQEPATSRAIFRETWRESFVFGKPDPRPISPSKEAAQGASRPEFEYPIPLSDAQQLMNLCLRPLVEKMRYVIKYGNKRWEVDEFHGDNRGLILAEIELSREDEPIEIPLWVGQEVSGDPRYFNSYLSEHPYTQWHSK